MCVCVCVRVSVPLCIQTVITLISDCTFGAAQRGLCDHEKLHSLLHPPTVCVFLFLSGFLARYSFLWTFHQFFSVFRPLCLPPSRCVAVPHLAGTTEANTDPKWLHYEMLCWALKRRKHGSVLWRACNNRPRIYSPVIQWRGIIPVR